MSQAAEVRAFKWKGSDLIGRKFHGNGLALRQFLVNMESFQLESMISVECCNDQLMLQQTSRPSSAQLLLAR